MMDNKRDSMSLEPAEEEHSSEEELTHEQIMEEDYNHSDEIDENFKKNLYPNIVVNKQFHNSIDHNRLANHSTGNVTNSTVLRRPDEECSSTENHSNQNHYFDTMTASEDHSTHNGDCLLDTDQTLAITNPIHSYKLNNLTSNHLSQETATDSQNIPSIVGMDKSIITIPDQNIVADPGAHSQLVTKGTVAVNQSTRDKNVRTLKRKNNEISVDNESEKHSVSHRATDPSTVIAHEIYLSEMVSNNTEDAQSISKYNVNATNSLAAHVQSNPSDNIIIVADHGVRISESLEEEGGMNRLNPPSKKLKQDPKVLANGKVSTLTLTPKVNTTEKSLNKDKAIVTSVSSQQQNVNSQIKGSPLSAIVEISTNTVNSTTLTDINQQKEAQTKPRLAAKQKQKPPGTASSVPPAPTAPTVPTDVLIPSNAANIPEPKLATTVKAKSKAKVISTTVKSNAPVRSDSTPTQSASGTVSTNTLSEIPAPLATITPNEVSSPKVAVSSKGIVAVKTTVQSSVPTLDVPSIPPPKVAKTTKAKGKANVNVAVVTMAPPPTPPQSTSGVSLTNTSSSAVLITSTLNEISSPNATGQMPPPKRKIAVKPTAQSNTPTVDAVNIPAPKAAKTTKAKVKSGASGSTVVSTDVPLGNDPNPSQSASGTALTNTLSEIPAPLTTSTPNKISSPTAAGSSKGIVAMKPTVQSSEKTQDAVKIPAPNVVKTAKSKSKANVNTAAVATDPPPTPTQSTQRSTLKEKPNPAAVKTSTPNEIMSPNAAELMPPPKKITTMKPTVESDVPTVDAVNIPAPKHAKTTKAKGKPNAAGSTVVSMDIPVGNDPTPTQSTSGSVSAIPPPIASTPQEISSPKATEQEQPSNHEVAMKPTVHSHEPIANDVVAMTLQSTTAPNLPSTAPLVSLANESASGVSHSSDIDAEGAKNDPSISTSITSALIPISVTQTTPSGIFTNQ